MIKANQDGSETPLININNHFKEIEVLHCLKHPNIVLYMGVAFDHHKACYMVTEFVNQGSLFDVLHIEREHLSEMQAFTIAKQIAMAMNYL